MSASNGRLPPVLLPPSPNPFVEIWQRHRAREAQADARRARQAQEDARRFAEGARTVRQAEEDALRALTRGADMPSDKAIETTLSRLLRDAAALQRQIDQHDLPEYRHAMRALVRGAVMLSYTDKDHLTEDELSELLRGITEPVRARDEHDRPEPGDTLRELQRGAAALQRQCRDPLSELQRGAAAVKRALERESERESERENEQERAHVRGSEPPGWQPDWEEYVLEDIRQREQKRAHSVIHDSGPPEWEALVRKAEAGGQDPLSELLRGAAALECAIDEQ